MQTQYSYVQCEAINAGVLFFNERSQYDVPVVIGVDSTGEALRERSHLDVRRRRAKRPATCGRHVPVQMPQFKLGEGKFVANFHIWCSLNDDDVGVRGDI